MPVKNAVVSPASCAWVKIDGDLMKPFDGRQLFQVSPCTEGWTPESIEACAGRVEASRMVLACSDDEPRLRRMSCHFRCSVAMASGRSPSSLMISTCEILVGFTAAGTSCTGSETVGDGGIARTRDVNSPELSRAPATARGSTYHHPTRALIRLIVLHYRCSRGRRKKPTARRHVRSCKTVSAGDRYWPRTEIGSVGTVYSGRHGITQTGLL